MGNLTPLPTKEAITDYYLVKNRTLRECSDYFNVSQARLKRLLPKYNLTNKKTIQDRREQARRFWDETLPTKKQVEYEKLCAAHSAKELPDISKEELYNYYVIEGNSRDNCSQHFGITKYVLIRLLESYNIQKAPPKVEVSKEDFYNYFIEQNHTFEETANHFNITKNQAVNLGRRYDIKKPSYLFSQHVTEMNKNRWANTTEEELDAFKQKIRATKALKTDEEKCRHAAKGYETRRKHGTITTSKPEETTYTQLCEMFGESNIIRQYKSEQYPFHCDFYIKPLDAYLELNLYWGHGFHPFDAANEKDITKLAHWQNKADAGKASYKRAINTWTVRDPLKIKTALNNNLRYYIVYKNKDIQKTLELLNHLNTLKENI